MAVSEKGGDIDEKRMEDFLDCVRGCASHWIYLLCNCMDNGGDDGYDI